jgi:FkbM family methyltransferase
VEVDDFDGSLKMGLRLGEHMQSQNFWYGYYSRDVVLLLKRLLKRGATVFDVGANIGEIALVAANCVGRKGRVYAFEPVSTLFQSLEKNIAINQLDHIAAFQRGLADRDGRTVIYKQRGSFSDGTVHEGLGSIFASESRSEPIEEIQLTTMDQLVKEQNVRRLDLVKIDVEGAELSVLRGSIATLERFRPYIILELQSQTANSAGHEQTEILELIENLGYSIYTIQRKACLSPLSRESLRAFQNVLCAPDGADIQ